MTVRLAGHAACMVEKRERNMYMGFCGKNLKERDYLQDLGIGGNVNGL
jgi:hypothetical protein